MTTLYVARDQRNRSRLCKGSTLCVDVVQRLPSHVAPRVVDCDGDTVRRPGWLRGTPTLHRESDGVTWTGYGAVQQLHSLLLDATTQRHPPRNDHLPLDGADPTKTATEEEADDGTTTEESLLGERKLTTDDFQRVLSSRNNATNPHTPTPSSVPSIDTFDD